MRLRESVEASLATIAPPSCSGHRGARSVPLGASVKRRRVVDRPTVLLRAGCQPSSIYAERTSLTWQLVREELCSVTMDAYEAMAPPF